MYIEHTIILYSYSRGGQKLFSGPKGGPVFLLHRLTGGPEYFAACKRGPKKLMNPDQRQMAPLLVKNNRSLKVSKFKVWKNLKVILRQRASQDTDTKK